MFHSRSSGKNLEDPEDDERKFVYIYMYIYIYIYIYIYMNESTVVRLLMGI